MSFFRYDFGYAWPWTSGHLLAALFFGAIALVAWRAGWPRWVSALLGALTAWALVGAFILHVVMRFNLPLTVPTQAFLTGQTGRVLDLGAGSGRATLMVLLDRPHSRVVALDIFSDRYGIDGNTPERLRANVAAAGAADRLEVQTADMREMPFADASFDGAVSAFAIDHLDREGITRALAETHRVLTPGGDFLLLVLNPDAWIRVALPMFYEHGYFGRQPAADVWRQRLVEGGFDVIEVGTTPGTLYLLGRTPAGTVGR